MFLKDISNTDPAHLVKWQEVVSGIDGIFDPLLQRIDFIDDLSGNVKSCMMTKDYTLYYNTSYVEGTDSYILLFTLQMMVLEIILMPSEQQFGRDTKLWEQSVNLETAVRSLMWGHRPPHHTPFWQDGLYSQNQRQHNQNRPDVKQLIRQAPDSQTYNTCEYYYRNLDAHAKGLLNPAPNCKNFKYKHKETSDLLSVDHIAKCDWLAKENDLEGINVSRAEHEEIMRQIVGDKHKSGPRGQKGGNVGNHLSAMFDVDRDASLAIDWDRIIQDMESTASGNKVGGSHDYGMDISKKQMGGLLLPAMVGGKTSKICMILDNSVSVSYDDLIAYRDQVGVLLSNGIRDIDVIYCDTRGKLFPGINDIDDLPLVRGHGTNMVNGLDMAFNQPKNYDLVIVISDGDTPYPDTSEYPCSKFMFVIVENQYTDLNVVPDDIQTFVVTRS